jgi:hypothetical protein
MIRASGSSGLRIDLSAGAMTTTVELRDADGGTDVLAVHEGVPEGVQPEQNEEGWRMALAGSPPSSRADPAGGWGRPGGPVRDRL